MFWSLMRGDGECAANLGEVQHRVLAVGWLAVQCGKMVRVESVFGNANHFFPEGGNDVFETCEYLQ